MPKRVGWTFARSGQHHAVDDIEQRSDVRDLGRSRKHQRQRAGDVGHRPKIALADQLGRKSIFDAMGVPDHTDHRPPHYPQSDPKS